MELRKMISCITSITIEKPLEKYGQIYPHPQLVEIRKTGYDKLVLHYWRLRELINGSLFH